MEWLQWVGPGYWAITGSATSHSSLLICYSLHLRHKNKNTSSSIELIVMSLFVSVTPLLLGSNSTVITALNGIDGFIFNYDPLLQTRHCQLCPQVNILLVRFWESIAHWPPQSSHPWFPKVNAHGKFLHRGSKGGLGSSEICLTIT